MPKINTLMLIAALYTYSCSKSPQQGAEGITSSPSPTSSSATTDPKKAPPEPGNSDELIIQRLSPSEVAELESGPAPTVLTKEEGLALKSAHLSQMLKEPSSLGTTLRCFSPSPESQYAKMIYLSNSNQPYVMLARQNSPDVKTAPTTVILQRAQDPTGPEPQCGTQTRKSLSLIKWFATRKPASTDSTSRARPPAAATQSKSTPSKTKVTTDTEKELNFILLRTQNIMRKQKELADSGQPTIGIGGVDFSKSQLNTLILLLALDYHAILRQTGK